jgi:hypothetical protein
MILTNAQGRALRYMCRIFPGMRKPLWVLFSVHLLMHLLPRRVKLANAVKDKETNLANADGKMISSILDKRYHLAVVSTKRRFTSKNLPITAAHTVIRNKENRLLPATKIRNRSIGILIV